MYVARNIYEKQQEKLRAEQKDAKTAREEAKLYLAERDVARVECEKEKMWKLELSQNIVTTVHNTKSPTTALGITRLHLAVAQ